MMDKYRQSRDSNRLITLMRLKDSLNTKIPKSTDTDIIKTDICPILLVNPCFNQGGYYIRRGWPDCGFVCLDEET
ncbi:MAG: hypothetical protein LBU14_06435 [Candidatus Peribacteria bacterium]|nr:hypothetical protein [Candidatus Peribacteria bacterium]